MRLVFRNKFATLSVLLFLGLLLLIGLPALSGEKSKKGADSTDNSAEAAKVAQMGESAKNAQGTDSKDPTLIEKVEKDPAQKDEGTKDPTLAVDLDNLEEFEGECLDCHADKDIEPITPGRTAASLIITPRHLRGSVHEDMGCSDCHKSDVDADKPHFEGGSAPMLLCGSCHEEALAIYNQKDIHGKHYQKNDPDAPWCNDCHGDHQIKPLSSQESNLSRTKQPELCGKCHGQNGFDTTQHSGIAKRRLLERYYSSAHWSGIQKGKPSATCSDCHGHHSILPSSDPNSTVARSDNLPKTCSKCHPQAASAYMDGSHGQTLSAGNLDVPTCTTCHGDHDIVSLRIQASGKRSYAATQVCIWCHSNERMMARYALDTSPVDHYMRDYHGMAQRGSMGTSATCADCHDAHHSLPESHPNSRMHLSNRGTTCGACHGQASESFIMSFSHRVEAGKTESDSKAVYYITIIYIALIILTIGGMFIHNLIIWLYYTRKKIYYQRAHGEIVRMNKFERFWHWILFIAFSMLALSGFMLSFSESYAIKWIYDLGFTEFVRAWIHHFMGIILVLDMLLILTYGIFSKWGRKYWTEMFPRWKDVKDFTATMRMHLTLKHEPVQYSVYNYAEKAEWWALLWGTLVMAVTGLIMWFPELLPPNSPEWLFRAVKTVHYYEAVLACLAIIVWHFFHVMFHPAESPMNTSWLTGKLTSEEAEERFSEKAINAQKPPKENLPVIEKPEKKAWMEEDEKE